MNVGAQAHKLGAAEADSLVALSASPHRRLLKIAMHDGQQQVVGIEYRPISDLSVATSPGCKIVVRDAEIRRGLLLLTPTNVHVVGGAVKELVAIRDGLNRAIAAMPSPLQSAASPSAAPMGAAPVAVEGSPLPAQHSPSGRLSLGPGASPVPAPALAIGAESPASSIHSSFSPAGPGSGPRNNRRSSRLSQRSQFAPPLAPTDWDVIPIDDSSSEEEEEGEDREEEVEEPADERKAEGDSSRVMPRLQQQHMEHEEDDHDMDALIAQAEAEGHGHHPAVDVNALATVPLDSDGPLMDANDLYAVFNESSTSPARLQSSSSAASAAAQLSGSKRPREGQEERAVPPNVGPHSATGTGTIEVQDDDEDDAAASASAGPQHRVVTWAPFRAALVARVLGRYSMSGCGVLDLSHFSSKGGAYRMEGKVGTAATIAMIRAKHPPPEGDITVWREAWQGFPQDHFDCVFDPQFIQRCLGGMPPEAFKALLRKPKDGGTEEARAQAHELALGMETHLICEPAQITFQLDAAGPPIVLDVVRSYG